MNARKIDQMNNEMFSSKPNYVRPLVVIAAIILVLLAGFVLSVKTSHAMPVENSSASDFAPTFEVSPNCIPYAHAQVVKGYGFFSHTITLTHGICVEIPANENSSNENNNQDDTKVTLDNPVILPSNPVIDAPTAPIVDTDTSTDEDNSTDTDTSNDKVKHPNSGRGNGSEIVDGVDVDPGNSGGHNHGGD